MNELKEDLDVIANMNPSKLDDGEAVASNGLLDCKIVQLLMTPNDSTWQGRLLGLGSDGNTYEATNDGWKPLIANVEQGAI